MGDGNLGLTFSIDADPSAAEAALKGFQSTSQTVLADFKGYSDAAFARATTATKPFQDALLNQHQTVHLLAEEMGVHLPRAVVSGISEMLPNIASLGTVLLGVFALDMVVKFGEKVHKIAEEFDGVAAAEKRAGEIEKENLSFLEKAVEGNRKLLMGELQRAQFRAVTDEAELNRLKAHDMQILAATGLLGVGYLGLAGALGKVQQAQANLTADQELADKLAKILTSDIEKEAKGHEKAAKSAKDLTAGPLISKRSLVPASSWAITLWLSMG
jgi:hypothetical protein